MPTYTYRCKVCGHQFDERQKFSDDPLVECPECDGRLRRLVNNSAGIVFKGSGFYINDSKTGKKSSVTSNGSNSSPNGDGTDSGNDKKSDSATEKKSESKEKSSKAETA